MSKCRFVLGILSIAALLFWSAGAWASGVITFQVEVLPGLTLSSPDNLVFEPVAPGQTKQKDLEITVWSNVSWELSVQGVELDGAGDVFGELEVEGVQGSWYEVIGSRNWLRLDQSPTGPSGADLEIPFRFTGSYEDSPGTYLFQIEFTVVPKL